MKVILFSDGRSTLVDDVDYVTFSIHAYYCHANGYATRTENYIDGTRTIYLHREIHERARWR